MNDCYLPIYNNSVEKQHQPQQHDMIEVTQHLAPEQFQYEFPPKSHIMALEAQDLEAEEFSFFDESSYTSTSTADYSNVFFQEQEQEEQDYDSYIHSLLSNTATSDQLIDQYLDSFQTNDPPMSLVADNQLSPLQLPLQANFDKRHLREESCDSSTGTIVMARPSSFLSSTHHTHYLERIAEKDRINWDESHFVFPDYSMEDQRAYQSVHPYQRSNNSRRNSEADIFYGGEDDLSSNFSSNSKVVFMKISKTHMTPPVFIQYSHNDGSYTDEGYDDEDEDYCNKPIESDSVFLPLSEEEQSNEESHLHLAATKIQAVWRGHRSRKDNTKGPMKLSHRVLAGLAQVNNSIHRRNNNQLQGRIHTLEKRLEEETAMRIAFEKAMEEMTVLMDHQHHVLNERVEREVDMRQAYEQKMERVMTQVQPLEARLRHESKARADMESMMSRVLDQLHEMKVQAKEEAEERKSLQCKLDMAVQELASLKKQQPQQPTVSRLRTSTARPIGTSRPAGRTATPEAVTRSISRTTAVSRTTSSKPTQTLRPSVASRPTSVSRTTATATTTTKKSPTGSRISTRTVINRKP